MATQTVCYGDAKGNPNQECNEGCLQFFPDQAKVGWCTCGHAGHRHKAGANAGGGGIAPAPAPVFSRLSTPVSKLKYKGDAAWRDARLFLSDISRNIQEEFSIPSRSTSGITFGDVLFYKNGTKGASLKDMFSKKVWGYLGRLNDAVNSNLHNVSLPVSKDGSVTVVIPSSNFNALYLQKVAVRVKLVSEEEQLIVLNSDQDSSASDTSPPLDSKRKASEDMSGYTSAIQSSASSKSSPSLKSRSKTTAFTADSNGESFLPPKKKIKQNTERIPPIASPASSTAISKDLCGTTLQSGESLNGILHKKKKGKKSK